MPVTLTSLTVLYKKPFAFETSIVKYRSVNVFLLSYNLQFSRWSYLHPSRTVPLLLLPLFGDQKLRLGSCFLKFLDCPILPELSFTRCTLKSAFSDKAPWQGALRKEACCRWSSLFLTSTLILSSEITVC